jgi:RNA polymerase sigma-70 factor (ECF subfamily)
MREQDDNILVQRVLDGETDTFRLIVEKYQKTIFYLGLKFFHNHVDAEDFAQEVFLKVFENLGSFKGRGMAGQEKPVKKKASFKSWLYRLAFNLAVSMYHLNKRKFLLAGDRGDHLLEGDTIMDSAGSIEADLIKKETVERIKHICAELPGAYNVVIKMHFFDGLKLAEIQDILDIPLNTVKSYVFRAKVMIKKRLLAEKKVDNTRIEKRE